MLVAVIDREPQRGLAHWLSRLRAAAETLSQFLALRPGKYVIGVFVAWILLFVAGYFLRGPMPGYPVWHVFEGFLLGMLAIDIAIRLRDAAEQAARLTLWQRTTGLWR